MESDPTTEKDLWLQGIPLSPGIATGISIVRTPTLQEPIPETIDQANVANEIKKFLDAINEVSAQLDDVSSNLEKTYGKDQADIFEAHKLILTDPTVLEQVEEEIESKKLSAPYLYHSLMSKHADTLRQTDDKYIKERADDIEDVTLRVLKVLGSEGDPLQAPDFPHILIAEELHPSDTAEMDVETVRAFAVSHGSPTSHVAIISRSLGIPAVGGIPNLLSYLHSGDEMIIDGDAGVIVLRPSEESFAEFTQKKQEREELNQELLLTKKEPPRTLDGKDLIVSANIEFKRELETISENGASGIGLYRTEFLFLSNIHPDEKIQTETYQTAIEAVSPDSVIFRTVDLGGDKTEPIQGYQEPNPFLGWRGIRYSLDRPHSFKTQVRAILRAATNKKVGIMFPMISNLDEVKEAKSVIKECVEYLQDEGIAEPRKLEIGAMIEVPSAALIADSIAKEVDFLSIGTNDLIQYTTAVDRVNDRVNHLYQPLHPAVIRLIVETSAASERAGIWTGVCGEMASDILALPILLGAGITELSMTTKSVPRIKYALRRLDAGYCQHWLAENLEHWDSANQIHHACLKIARKSFPELIPE